MTLLSLLIWTFSATRLLAASIRGQRQPQQLRGFEPEGINSGLTLNSLPSKCLEFPEYPECRRRGDHRPPQPSVSESLFNQFPRYFLYGDSSPRASPTSPPAQQSASVTSFVSEFYYDESTYIVSSRPTKDMCYGNMARYNKKFCNSEMPSVSLEPSDQPTTHLVGNNNGGANGSPGGPSSTPSMPPFPQPTIPEPSLSPMASPETPQPAAIVTLHPSPSPSWSPSTSMTPTRFGQCQGDCDKDEDCEEGLLCYHRDPYEAVPGCVGTEYDGSRTDYCTVFAHPTSSPASAPTEDLFHLKLYWDSTYTWQDSNEERKWCLACWDVCSEDDNLYLVNCDGHTPPEYFDFISGLSENTTMIQVVNSELCLERWEDDTSVGLQPCNFTDPLQQWSSPDGGSINATDDSFEISQPIDGVQYCLTTHHHPKHGEELELFPCSVARKDQTSLWGPY